MSDLKQQEGTSPLPAEPLTDAQIREALTNMHRGLVIMQDRLDDHEKVIEQLIAGLTNLAEASAPKNGFRTPPKNKVQ